MRVMTQPISAEKMKVTIGIAPVPYDKLKKTNNFNDIGFPMVEVNSFSVDIFPKEDDDTSHGIGFLPFILSRVDSKLASILHGHQDCCVRPIGQFHHAKCEEVHENMEGFHCQRRLDSERI